MTLNLYRVRGRDLEVLVRAMSPRRAAIVSIDVARKFSIRPPNRIWVAILTEPEAEGLVYEAEQTEACFWFKKGMFVQNQMADAEDSKPT